MAYSTARYGSTPYSQPIPFTFISESGATEVAVSSTETCVPGNRKGSTVILGIAARGSVSLQSVVSVTDTAGNVWQSVGKTEQFASGLGDVELWWTTNAAVCGTVTVTLSGLCSTVLCTMEVAPEFSLVTTDLVGINLGFSGAFDGGGGILPAAATAYELVVAFCGSDSTAAITSWAAGFDPLTARTSLVTLVNCQGQMFYQNLTAIKAANTLNFTANAASGNTGTVMATFKLRPGATPLAAAEPERLTGTPTLALKEALAATGQAALTGTPALTPAEALAATGRSALTGSANGLAVTNVAATGQAGLTGGAGATLAQALAATGRSALTGTATPSQAVTLGATGVSALTGTAGAGSGAALAATGVITLTGQVLDREADTIAATGVMTLGGTAGATVATTLAASGLSALTGRATVTSATVLGALGAITSTGTGALGAGYSYAATGQSWLTGFANLTAIVAYASGVVGSPAPGIRGAAATNIIGSPAPAIRGTETGNVIGSPAPAIRGTGT